MSEADVVWVVGAGGLLGGSVLRELEAQGRPVRRVVVPWEDPGGAEAALTSTAAEIVRTGPSWRVMWCAGAAVVGATDERVAAELRSLGAFLGALRHHGGNDHGTLFLASSAGGVHAGSHAPPFTEHTPAAPTSAYGRGKLDAEHLVTRLAHATGTRVVIGRIANLYGPGQNLAKAQGLVSQLCLSHLSRQPLSIYVPLDTARDYIFSRDAARLAIACLDRATTEPDGSVTVKLVASQQAATIGAILGELHRITRRRPHVTLGLSPLSRLQTSDLRFASKVWTDLDALVSTGLPVGMSATLDGLAAAVSAPRRSPEE